MQSVSLKSLLVASALYYEQKLWGKSNTERAEALIAIANPDFRESLRQEYKAWMK